jgi:hypothetical protein
MLREENAMADDKRKRGGQDRELRDWSKRFGVTPDDLKKAFKPWAHRPTRSGSISANNGPSAVNLVKTASVPFAEDVLLERS